LTPAHSILRLFPPFIPPFCDSAHTRSHSSVHILSGRANNYSLSDTFGSTIIPLGRRTTKYIRWIGPSLVSEKQKNQCGTGLVLNSWLSIVLTCMLWETLIQSIAISAAFSWPTVFGTLCSSVSKTHSNSEAILSMIPISKQLNGSRRANYQETREGCCQQPAGSFSGIKRPWPIIGSESKIQVSRTSLSTARCEAAYPSRAITLGAPCCLTAREKNRLASENG